MPTRDHQLTRRGFGRLGLAAAAAGATATATASSARAVGESTFRVGHLNILFSLSDARFFDDLRNVTGRAEMVSLNEVAARRDLLLPWADNNGWHIFCPSGAAGGETLLARKSVFVREAVDSVLIHDFDGDGRPPRYVNWARYVHRVTGRTITHLNTHCYSSIDVNGSPDAGDPHVAANEAHLRRLRDMAHTAAGNGQVIVSGDFNVDYVDDRRVQYSGFPYTVLEERQAPGALPGLRSHYSLLGVTGLPTHGDRRIDYIYEYRRVTEFRRMRMDNAYVFNETHSDHNGVVARFVLDA